MSLSLAWAPTSAASGASAVPLNALTSISDNAARIDQNATSFAVNQWTTDAHQYIAFYEGTTGTVTVGKRAIDSTSWSFFDLSSDGDDVTGTAPINDVHYITSIAVDDDGYIHVVANTYNDATISYMRSTAPNDITAWEAPTFTHTGIASYTTFIQCSDGELLAMYRDGGSTNGRMWLSAYDTETQTWANRVNIAEDGVGNVGNAYWNDIVVGPDGRIHLWWTWRMALTANYPGNVDVVYAYSDDNGATWRKKSDGTAYTLPITAPGGEAVQSVAESGHMLNQSGAAVDADGNPHSIWKLDDGSDYLNFFHSWHNGSSWQWEQVSSFTDFSGSTADNSKKLCRPAIACFADGTIWCIYRRTVADGGPRVHYIDISTPGDPGAEAVLIDYGTDSSWEPAIDHRLLALRDELSMLVMPVNGDVGFSPAPTGQAYHAIIKSSTPTPIELPETNFPVAPYLYAYWAEGDEFATDGYADTDAVPTWSNERGGRDLTEATNQPTFDEVVAALNNKSAVSFNGTNDLLSTSSAFTELQQPYSLTWIGNIRTVGDVLRLIDGSATERAALIGPASAPYYYGCFAGSSVVSETTITTGAHIVIANFDGANSSLWVDGVEVDTGDTGSNGISTLRLGAAQNGTAFSAVDTAFAGVSMPLSDELIARLVEWSATHYGTPSP